MRGWVTMVLASYALAASTARAATPLPERSDARSIYDAAGVLDAQRTAELETLNAQLFAKTGVAIVVITVPALADETIEALAVRVLASWGVGKKGEDRGIVMALSVGDRKVFVATGYGVEGFLNDAKVGRLIDQHAIGAFKQGDFSTGTYQLVTAIAATAAREYGITLDGAPLAEPSQPTPTSPWNLIAPFVIGMVLLVGGGILYKRNPVAFWAILTAILSSRRSSGWGGGSGGFGGGGFGGGGFGGFGGGSGGGGGAGRSF